MKILQLTAENVKKLRAVEITPTGELVEITGRNGQGKTSVLDSIWWALAGTKHIQAVPIRNGATTARIRLDLGELVVERRFTPGGKSTLTVENADGARYTSPQGILDAILGELTFDPLAFVNEDPREQFDTLRAIAPVAVDIEKLEGLNRHDYDRRTEINREVKSKRAQADGITLPEVLPEAFIDTAKLMDRMAAAAEVNAEIETAKALIATAAKKVEETREAIERARAEAADLRDRAARIDAGIVKHQAILEDLQQLYDTMERPPAPTDVAAIRREIEEASTINRQIAERDRRAALLLEVEALTAQATELSATIEAREKVKADAITAAPMPVEGLGFGAGVVLFNGLPFDQASTAEQLRVSVGIAMAANPKLRVLRIKEGSLLDADNVALIASLAREKDYQVWLERVDMSGKVGVVIEDGSVIAVDGAAPPPAAAAKKAR